MKKISKTLSLVALCAVMIVMSVVPAFATENTESVQLMSASYVEDHSVIDCASYWVDGSYYRFLIKVSKGVSIGRVTVENVFTDEVKNLESGINSSYESVEYQYSDSTSDCYLYSVYIYPGSPKYMWYEYGIKLFYDYNGSHYMATNTANGSTTEGPGYILKRY
ncbi:MAG: hypothetical protein K2M82_03145 [Lachnospiraceae bacterium]|nr:hypothetical protein [Lachnospiraceae bacterium]